MKMKEKLLVLTKTYPIVSKKYEHLVCVAGITDKGELRRIYPVPFEVFWNEKSFKKKNWIEYETESDEPSDHRPESRKIITKTIKDLGPASFKELKELIEQKIISLEELYAKNPREVSLGIIKPNKLIDFVEEANENYKKIKEKGKQTTLIDGESAVKIWIPKNLFSYKFNCSESCPIQHKIMCEDWELIALYRNCDKYREQGKYIDLNLVFEKVKYKFFNVLPNKRDFYFVVGTHYRFKTYIVVGVIYPKKADKY